MNHNPKLALWLKPTPSKEAGINNIQMPGQPQNIVWQTRPREPNAYELALSQHLISGFKADKITPADLAAHFNEQGFRHEGGGDWDSVNFEAEMARLGY